MTKAVMFDMDGLLVDTEPLNVSVVAKVCDELGIKLTAEEKHYCASGITNRKFYSEIFNKRKLNFNLDEILNKTFAIYDEELKKEPRHFPGAESLPKLLKSKNYKLALVSGSTKNQVEIVLTGLNIKDLFDVVITADDIGSSKPDPEGYLLAAKQLNVSAQECVALEDGAEGVKAAKSAGMKVIGVLSNDQQDLSLADLVVKNLTDIDIDKISNFSL